MMQRTDNIVDAVQNALEARGLDKAVINNASFHVQRAIITLQRADLLPPREVNFLAIDEKQEYRNAKGELVFNYVMLPKGFSKLYELYVDGYEPYTYTHYINYLSSRKESKNTFSIQNINLEDFTVPVMVLAMDPFPDDDTPIRLLYHTDGTSDDLDWFGPEYWDAVIAQVEEYVGVARKGSAEEYAHDIMSRRQNAQGRQHVNKTMQRVKPFGFGGKRC
jgi:hypothetical protein